MKIVFFDTETTGNGERDRLLQLAVKERGASEAIANTIYKPPLPITFGAMAVHHITEKMTEGRPAFKEAEEYEALKELFEDGDTIAIAHNAAFDIGMLAREGIRPSRTICTYKVVRRLDEKEEMEQYKLQYLRYRLGLDIEADAHDAMGDVLVLEGVFEKLLEEMVEQGDSEEEAIEKMVEISQRPMLFSTLRFGKYNGKRLEEIARKDKGYLEWLLAQKRQDPVGERDWIYTLEYYLDKARKQ